MWVWILAVIVGALAGVITPFAWWLLNDWAERVFLRFHPIGAPSNDWGYALFLPAVAAFSIVFLMLLFRGFRSADGFTYFISDLHFQNGRRKLRYSLLHGVASWLLLFGQAVVGMEGLCLEILSALGSRLAEWRKLSAHQTRTLAGCGATAALAALFGQPAAAFLFVVELLYGWGNLSYSMGAYAVTAFTAVSISQSLTSPSGFFRSLYGTDGGLAAILRMEAVELSWQTAIVCLLFLGVLTGVFAAINLWLHQKTDRELHRLFESRRAVDISGLAMASRLGLWAVLTGISIMYFPEAMGTGVSLFHDILSPGYLAIAALLALLLRMLLGVLAYSVLGSMGLIFPTLVLGGILGATVSLFLQPYYWVNPGIVALLSMGGYFSAAFGTPVAATALVYGLGSELLSDHALFLLTALGVNFLSNYVCGRFFADRLAAIGLYRHGIRFRNGMCYNTLSGIQVRDAMVTYVAPLMQKNSMGDAYRSLMESKFSKLPVLDEGRKLIGMVSLADFYGSESLRALGEESQVHSLVGVDEMMTPPSITVTPEMNLESALRKMSDEDLVPVIDEEQRYEGILLKSDLVHLYNKEVVKKNLRR